MGKVPVCTTPDEMQGTVLIILKGGQVAEVISDVQLDVEILDLDNSPDGSGYSSHPSRPLWEFLRKSSALLLSGSKDDTPAS